jgi:hypothetical protein
MTFEITPRARHAPAMSAISAITRARSPDCSARILITMSISPPPCHRVAQFERFGFRRRLPQRKADRRAGADPRSLQKRDTARRFGRVDRHHRKPIVRRLRTQLFDVGRPPNGFRNV